MSAKITGGLLNGVNGGIGATALALSTETAGLLRGVCVKSLASNAEGSLVYVGGSGVTTADGFPLAPGETVSVESGRACDVFVIGSTSGLEVRWLGV